MLKDLEYGSYEVSGAEKKLLLDLYMPEKRSAQPFPLLIYIHGGGWMEGDKGGCPGDLIAQHGYALASINYRLSDEAIFPAQIHDVKRAVRWLRANAGKHNLDPNRFGAMGDSAGGHLSALLGTSAGVAPLEGEEGHQGVSSEIQAVCDWYGPTDFTQVPPAFTQPVSSPVPPTILERYGDKPWFEYTLATALLVGGRVSAHPDLATLANPITHVGPNDPPFLIVHGEQDNIVPLSQSQLLADALGKSGVEVTFVRQPNRGHSLAGPRGEEFSPKLIEMALQFFDAHLRP